ncbi:MAG TPA: N-acetylmuramoyl-L-alanine amidase [Thermoanaerobaculia bacterium]|nr:N-acetylmuramoyl-L-alanine amidase [Thermoanaerobaculia bacterium]
MSAGKISRVKRRLLRQAVADNVETIRGLPPRQVRPGNRLFRVWSRRAPALLLLLLAGSTWVASNPSPPDTIAPAQIVVRRTRTGAAPVIDSLQRVDSSALSLGVQRVILDAGHGGSDPGAVTSTVPIAEKDITLDIARRLHDLLRKNGFQVVTTRKGDEVVPLRERARIANESEGDIFVSIHVNAIVKHTASRGVETYFLGPANDPALTRLAAQENRASGYSVADMRRLLDGIYADARRSESQRLAGSIQEQLHAGLKRTDSQLENWGVKRAPFLVLVATDMPAVLAEVGCMSNPVEAALLTRGDYRQEIAAALFEGIRTYASARDTKHGV